MKMVIKITINLGNLILCSFDAGKPGLKFREGIMIIIPEVCSMSMPAKIGNIGCEMNFWGEEGFINDTVSNLVFGKEAPGIIPHPREIPEFHHKVIAFRQDLEKGDEVPVIARVCEAGG